MRTLRIIRWWLIGMRDKLKPYLPRIPRKFPPAVKCSCGADTEIVAVLDGDSWVITRECPECGMYEEYLDWFPFVFGWANCGDMEKIGIRVES